MVLRRTHLQMNLTIFPNMQKYVLLHSNLNHFAFYIIGGMLSRIFQQF